MRRFAWRSVALLALPMVAGCFTVAQVPVPATAPERELVEVRGVVMRQADGSEERVEFQEIHQATWTPTGYSVVADVDNGTPQRETITRLFPISAMAGLLVRQVDPGRTSLLIGGFFVAAAGVIGVAFSGTAGY